MSGTPQRSYQRGGLLITSNEKDMSDSFSVPLPHIWQIQYFTKQIHKFYIVLPPNHIKINMQAFLAKYMEFKGSLSPP